MENTHARTSPNKTLRETATEIAKRYATPTERFQLAVAIEQALHDERERATRIVLESARNATEGLRAAEIAEKIRSDES